MKVSIITVTYNSASYIADCIKSVNDQSYHNIEHIIIDGASSDNTLVIVNTLLSRISKVVSEPDNGIYDAINKGIKLASGKIIGVLNSDDFYHRNDLISQIVETFTDKSIQSVFGDVRFVNPKNLNKTVRYYSSKRFSPHLFQFGIMPAHTTFFTYKKYFTEFGYYKTDYEIAGDFELLIRFMHVNKLAYKYLPIDMLKMRTGGKSTKSINSTLTINKEVIRACKENGIKTNFFLVSLKYFFKVFELFFVKN